MLKIGLASLLASTLLVGLAGADPAPAVFTVKADASTVTYHIVHKLHRVDGVSKKVEGRARLLPGGAAQVAIRVPVESFDSGNTNRDAHMKEVTEAAKYPTVELKAAGDGIVVPGSFPSTVTKTMKAQVVFHGITQSLDLPVTLRFDAANKVTVTTTFELSLDAFKVERPSLMFVKIDDAMKIDAALVLAP